MAKEEDPKIPKIPLALKIKKKKNDGKAFGVEKKNKFCSKTEKDLKVTDIK